MIRTNENGEVQCPNCRKVYKPVLVRKDDRCIQEQFPDAPKWQREQLISGICSDDCWKEFLGPEPEEEDDGPVGFVITFA